MPNQPADTLGAAWIYRVLGVDVSASPALRARLVLLRQLPADWERVATSGYGEVAALKQAIVSDPHHGQHTDIDTAIASLDTPVGDLFGLLDDASGMVERATTPDALRATTELLREAAFMLAEDPVLAVLDNNGFAPIKLITTCRALVAKYLDAAEQALREI